MEKLSTELKKGKVEYVLAPEFHALRKVFVNGKQAQAEVYLVLSDQPLEDGVLTIEVETDNEEVYQSN